MLAVAREGESAYGMTVRREIERRSGRAVTIGAVYSTLDRLEGKGYVRITAGEGTAARRGRGRRFFELTPSGVRALVETRNLRERMWSGLDAETLADQERA